MIGHDFPYLDTRDLNLDWLLKNMKQMIQEWATYQQTMNQNFANLEAAFNALHTWVNDYFDNLDVQQEINNKIEDMRRTGELAEVLHPLITSDVTSWLNTHITNPSNPPIDTSLSVTGAAADAKVVGDNIKRLDVSLRSELPVNSIYIDDFESGYYSSTNGTKIDSDSYIRVPYLIPIDGGSFYCTETGSEVQGALFTKAGVFIKRVYFEPDTGTDPYLDYVPVNAAFVGLYLKTTEPETDYISMRKINSADIQSCEYPFDDKNTIYTPGKYMDVNGTIRSDTGLALLRMVSVIPGTKYYISAQATNGICLAADNTVLSVDSEDVAPFGRIYTVPSGAVQINFNIRLADTKGVNSECSNYVAKISKPETILCIGDSITWLDGREGYGNMRYVTGWQMMLRKVGYDVRSAGFSGYPYATGLNMAGGVDHSIYKEIVTNEYDVSDYDYIILFGGTNDVLYGGTIGDRPTVYADRVYDASTFDGAISGIISYIRTNNPTAVLFLASFPKSEAVSRSYINASLRVAEIEYNADFWSCKYIDIFQDMNVQPTYDGFDEFFYDVTHPNYNGMVRIGKLMRKAVETYE